MQINKKNLLTVVIIRLIQINKSFFLHFTLNKRLVLLIRRNDIVKS